MPQRELVRAENCSPFEVHGQLKINYYGVSKKAPDSVSDAPNGMIYGICVETIKLKDGKVIETEEETVENVTCLENMVKKIIHILADNKVTSCSFISILNDIAGEPANDGDLYL